MLKLQYANGTQVYVNPLTIIRVEQTNPTTSTIYTAGGNFAVKDHSDAIATQWNSSLEKFAPFPPSIQAKG